MQEILSNDRHGKKQQIWTLDKKKKRRGPAPRCRACRTVQNKD